MSSGASKETSQETSVVASSKTLSPHSHGSADIATATTAGSVTNLDAASKRKNNNRSNNNKNKSNNNKKPRRSSPSASDKSKYSARSQGYGPASSQFAASGEVGDAPHPGSHASALYGGGEASSSSKEKEEVRASCEEHKRRRALNLLRADLASLLASTVSNVFASLRWAPLSPDAPFARRPFRSAPPTPRGSWRSSSPSAASLTAECR